MAQEEKTSRGGCCKVESIISVDERGQTVLPKEVREAAGIRPGDKLALILWRKGEEVCCLTLIKVDALAGMVKQMLSPLMKEMI